MMGYTNVSSSRLVLVVVFLAMLFSTCMSASIYYRNFGQNAIDYSDETASNVHSDAGYFQHPEILQRKRAVFRMGKRAMMRFGKRAMMRFGKRAVFRLG